MSAAGDWAIPELRGDWPIVVSNGLGVDSVGLLGALHQHNIRPDYIMFADVGDEHDETYACYDQIQQWLSSVGFPSLVVVRYKPKRFKYRPYATLLENCVVNHTLPSLAFGRKGCSLKWKGQPMDRHLLKQPWAQERLRLGHRLQRLIGFDCDARDTQRFQNARQKEEEGKGDPRFHFIYPLQALKLTRSDCEAIIRDYMLLPAVHKSSCFYCPSMKPEEVRRLPAHLLERIVIMEALAKPDLQKVEGLWRKATKVRPGSMTKFIQEQHLLPEDRLQACLQNPAVELEKHMHQRSPVYHLAAAD